MESGTVKAGQEQSDYYPVLILGLNSKVIILKKNTFLHMVLKCISHTPPNYEHMGSKRAFGLS